MVGRATLILSNQYVSSFARSFKAFGRPEVEFCPPQGRATRARGCLPLPAGLCEAWDLSVRSHLAEHVATNAKFAQVASWTAGELAAIL